MTVASEKMSSLTIVSVSETIYNNLITSMVQDIVSRITSQKQLLDSRYPDMSPLFYDPQGKLDIHGQPKIQESSIYFRCNNCDRDISANRYAAHLERCMSRGNRKT
ncbi:SAGA histone acetyltransferase complex subunit SGF11 Ecym_2546 [Eremothecium cymbalariae DBVPG|uniref:SAGA-associated factor 11 n=1 Tax=Eremothecium cymbalariae (strain CBS 270.75 / DBVPG 7215 / KCTC 17166 / NRRL Y-17582) TaxID=931890 RepID=G8JQA8_ERECY|nr:Hypothetical protein Ecym_2546 [Eremothecium cymbalariae DBVPG\